MRDRAPSSDGALVDAMSRWKGTGRYPAKGENGCFSGMGNPASRATIIDNLVKQGFLERIDRRSTAISGQGRRLLEFIHPDCQDADQVLRLHHWANLPLPEAKGMIDRYIRTFFGKQKRYLSKVG